MDIIVTELIEGEKMRLEVRKLASLGMVRSMVEENFELIFGEDHHGTSYH